LPVVADDGARAVFSIASQSSTSVACRPLRLGRPPGPGVVASRVIKVQVIWIGMELLRKLPLCNSLVKRK
jgi:hypothetical protein